MKFKNLKLVAFGVAILLTALVAISIYTVFHTNSVIASYSGILQTLSSVEGMRNLQTDLETPRADWKWMLLGASFFAMVAIVCLGIIFYRIYSHLVNVSGDLHRLSDRLGIVTKRILASAEMQENVAARQSASVNRTFGTAGQLSASTKQIGEIIRQVEQQVENTSQRFAHLSEKMQEIGNISTTIDDITQQINLLSMNAAIEAARAGEHGRGFAVLASEIRKLGENTGHSAEDVSNVYNDIQTSTSSATASIQQTVEGMKRVARSAQQQDLAALEMNSALGEINNGIKQNVGGIFQSVSGVDELSKLLSQVEDVLNELGVNPRTNGGTSAVGTVLQKPIYQNG